MQQAGTQQAGTPPPFPTLPPRSTGCATIKTQHRATIAQLLGYQNSCTSTKKKYTAGFLQNNKSKIRGSGAWQHNYYHTFHTILTAIPFTKASQSTPECKTTPRPCQSHESLTSRQSSLSSASAVASSLAPSHPALLPGSTPTDPKQTTTSQSIPPSNALAQACACEGGTWYPHSAIATPPLPPASPSRRKTLQEEFNGSVGSSESPTAEGAAPGRTKVPAQSASLGARHLRAKEAPPPSRPTTRVFTLRGGRRGPSVFCWDGEGAGKRRWRGGGGVQGT